jgi:hypothetical protein
MNVHAAVKNALAGSVIVTDDQLLRIGVNAVADELRELVDQGLVTRVEGGYSAVGQIRVVDERPILVRLSHLLGREVRTPTADGTLVGVSATSGDATEATATVRIARDDGALKSICTYRASDLLVWNNA